MDQIPIKYLVTQAQGLQQELGGDVVLMNQLMLSIFETPVLYKSHQYHDFIDRNQFNIKRHMVDHSNLK